MARRILRVRAGSPALQAGLEAIRREHGVPGPFPPEALAEAQAAADRGPLGEREDRRDVPLATLDPPGSRDLDQAFALERRGDGHRVRYAIADVAAFVAPGGAVDAEARRRAVTTYLPGERAPLHPEVLSEGAASLLPGEDRPALLWTIDLDARGAPAAVDLRRALVRSREQLDYPGAQAALDAGADERLLLLREVGERRIALERARGGIDVPTPDQEVEERDGHLVLVSRGPLPVERFNAQLSLLTGMCAAQRSLARGTGLLRTLPPADPAAVAGLREVATGLGVAWPGSAAEAIRAADPAEPAGAAFLEAATTLLRGAGYTPVGAGPTEHAAIAAPYAHVTAPLRRLADRFAQECCLPDPVPAWAAEALPALPGLMTEGQRRAGAAERAALDLVEALLLSGREGEAFEAVVVEHGRVVVADPHVRGRCEGEPPVGRRVTVRLAEADHARRRVRFAFSPAA